MLLYAIIKILTGFFVKIFACSVIKNHEHPFLKDDLQLSLKLYQLRKKYQNNKNISHDLDRVSSLLCDSIIKEARDILIKHSH